MINVLLILFFTYSFGCIVEKHGTKRKEEVWSADEYFLPFIFIVSMLFLGIFI